MKLDGLTNLAFDLFDRCPGGNTARQVGNIRGVVGSGVFDNDRVAHGFASLPRPDLFADAIWPNGIRLVASLGGKALGCGHADQVGYAAS